MFGVTNPTAASQQAPPPVAALPVSNPAVPQTFTSTTAPAVPQQPTGTTIPVPPSLTSTKTIQVQSNSEKSSFNQKLFESISKGRIEASFADEIKKKFSSPFASCNEALRAGSEISSGNANPSIGIPSPGVGGVPTSNLQPNLYGQPGIAANVPSSIDMVMQKQRKIELCTERGMELYSILMCCELSINDAARYAAGYSKENEILEPIQGIHAAVAAIASTAAADIISYITKEMAEQTEGIDFSCLNSTAFSSGSLKSSELLSLPRHSPLLLAAQDLYLLTRTFQMNETVVRDLLALVELVLGEVKRKIAGLSINATTFRSSTSTRFLSSFAWLLVFSLCNMLEVWKPLINSSGTASENALLRSNIVNSVDEWVHTVRQKVDSRSTGFAISGASESYDFLHRPTLDPHHDQNWQNSASSKVKHQGSSKCTWLSILHGYLSVVLFTMGCMQRAKGDDKGFDRIMESFLGDREAVPHALFRGKVSKRMVQLAPDPHTVILPLELIYIAPFEMMSYLFDELLPVMKRLSDFDLNSYSGYVEELQQIDDHHRHNKDGMNLNKLSSVGGHGNELLSMGFTANLAGFSCEVGNILYCLTECLSHLPPEVLNPDLESDCSSTFFIFKNTPKHLASVFKTQRPNLLWEPYTLKLVSRFLEILSMIARNRQHVARVMAFLSESQIECPELQWSSLLIQAQECAGMHGNTASLPNLMSSASFPISQSGSRGYQNTGRKYTAGYWSLRKQEFIASVFMLYRLMASDSEINLKFQEIIRLDVVIPFLFTPKLNQTVLGSTLSLLSALVTDSEKAEFVWSILEENKLLLPPNYSNGADRRRPLSHYSSDGEKQTATDELEAGIKKEDASLIGHCQLECHQKTYNITIGFLNLMISLFRRHIPSLGRFTTYTTVTHFIAQEVFCGITRRPFLNENERYTIISLASAALREALLLHFVSADNSIIPFATIMALNRAQNDVLEEIIKIIAQGSAHSYNITTYHVCAVRECISLLAGSINATKRQALELFSFESRTTLNLDLVSNILNLSRVSDNGLSTKSLQLLPLFPRSTINQAVREWYTSPIFTTEIVTSFSYILRPDSVSGGDIAPPTALLILNDDFLPALAYSPLRKELEKKSLLLDVLIEHASTLEPSLTSWLCGFPFLPIFGETYSSQDCSCFQAIMDGACSARLREKEPILSVKYIKLIYLLRSNNTYGSDVPRLCVGHQKNLFHILLALNDFQPANCSTPALSAYSYILKLLALEVLEIYKASPSELDIENMTLKSVPASILLRLLLVQGNGSNHMLKRVADSDSAIAGQRLPEDTSCMDLLQWLPLVLNQLVPFPDCQAPSGTDAYVSKALDGVIQFNIPVLYNALESSAGRKIPVNEMHEKLLSFVRANECFIQYSSTVHFIEGWCSIVDLASTIVQGVSQEHLRSIARCILASLDSTKLVTSAAQEQMCFRLCETLSTVLSQLMVRAQSELDRQLAASPFRSTSHNEEVPLSVTELDDTGASKEGYLKSFEYSLYPTQSGRRIEAPSLSGAITLKPQKRARDSFALVTQRENYPVTHESGLNQCLLHPLLVAIVQWGSCIPVIRGNLYCGLLFLTFVPGVTIEESTLYRYQHELLKLLSQDVCGDISVPSHQYARMLLTRLLDLSSPLLHYFCTSRGEPSENLSLMASSCVSHLLNSVDCKIVDFFCRGGRDLSSVVWLIRSTFDFLSTITRHHALQLFQANAIGMCLSMKIWNEIPPIILGHGKESGVDAFESSFHVKHSRTLAKRLLLSVLRWLNVLCASMPNSKAVITEARIFFNNNRQIIEYMMSSPLSYQKPIETLSLALYAELSDFLLHLSPSLASPDCPLILRNLALPELLSIFCSKAFRESSRFLQGDEKETINTTSIEDILDHTSNRPNSTLSRTVNGSQPSEDQIDFISTTARNISHFLLRMECCLSCNFTVSLISLQNDPKSASVGLLRNDPNSVSQILESTREVALTLTEKIESFAPFRRRQIENYLMALHALVFLLHSFLLPGTKKTTESSTAIQTQEIHRYLQSLPRSDMLSTLRLCQESIYTLKPFNSDFRTSVTNGPKETQDGWMLTGVNSASNHVYMQRKEKKAPLKRLNSLPRESNALGSSRREEASTTPPWHSPEGKGASLLASTMKKEEKSIPNLTDDRSFTNNISLLNESPSLQRYAPRSTDGKALKLDHRTGEVLIDSDSGPRQLEIIGRTQKMKAGFGHAAGNDSSMHTLAGEMYHADHKVSTTGLNLSLVPSSGINYADPDIIQDFSPEIHLYDLVSIESLIRQIKISIANAIRAITNSLESFP